jgi:hypothetical protein
MGTRYDQLGERLFPIEPDEGGSNYFRPEKEGLDPRLFEGDRLRPEVRSHLLGALLDFWGPRYVDPSQWAHVWIAGSALTRQWSDEGLGDLDVLVGVDLPTFYLHNPGFRGHPEAVIAREMNTELREELWPRMSDYNGFEVTYYVNPRTGTDIKRINPYAAYSLTHDRFDVQPSGLPERWDYDSVPAEWRRAIEDEVALARRLIERYNETVRSVAGAPPGPRRVTLLNDLSRVSAQVESLYGSIHGDRRNAFQGAFGTGGQGFTDYFNFRWQMHKKFGTGPTLWRIREAYRKAEKKAQEERYGFVPSKDVLSPSTMPR